MDEGCYICEPDEHQHDDPSCSGCDQGCYACFDRWLLAEGYAMTGVCGE